MLRAGVGASCLADSKAAAVAATRQAVERAGLDGPAQLAVVFATIEHGPQYAAIMRAVRETAAGANVVGCSARGVLTSDGEIEHGRAIAVLVLQTDHLNVSRFFVPNIRGRALAAGHEVGRQLRPFLGPENLVVLLPDTYNFHAPPVFAGLLEELGPVNIVGGGASEDGSLGETFQMCGDTISHDSVTGFLLSGNFRTTIGLTHACRPTGRPHTVTKADRNVILELDGRRAFDVLAESVPRSLLEQLRRAVATVFVGVPIRPGSERLERGNYLVRNIVGIDPEAGFLAVAVEVTEGQRVGFVLREPLGAREDLKEMVGEQAAAWRDAAPAFGIYFNCVARGSGLYGLADIDSAYLKHAFGDMPLIGFFTGAEIGPVDGVPFLHQYTGVLVVVGEEPPRRP